MLAFFLGIGFPLCHAGEEDTDEVGFTELFVTNSETHLLLFGVVTNAFSEEMTSGLKSGVPVDFSFFVELLLKDPGKGEKMVAEMRFRHTLAYDTLKDSYRVELEEFNNRIVPFRDLTAAENAMSEVNGAKIIELSQLAPNRTYQLRIRADLFKQTLPLSLHHIVPFLSWWDRETDWHTLEFNY